MTRGTMAMESRPGTTPAANQWPGDFEAEIVPCAGEGFELGPCKTSHNDDDTGKHRP